MGHDHAANPEGAQGSLRKTVGETRVGPAPGRSEGGRAVPFFTPVPGTICGGSAAPNEEGACSPRRWLFAHRYGLGEASLRLQKGPGRACIFEIPAGRMPPPVAVGGLSVFARGGPPSHAVQGVDQRRARHLERAVHRSLAGPALQRRDDLFERLRGDARRPPAPPVPRYSPKRGHQIAGLNIWRG